MTSVLLELGYMSNVCDLAKISSEQWRQSAADRVAQSIERYFTKRTAATDEIALPAVGLAAAR